MVLAQLFRYVTGASTPPEEKPARTPGDTPVGPDDATPTATPAVVGPELTDAAKETTPGVASSEGGSGGGGGGDSEEATKAAGKKETGSGGGGDGMEPMKQIDLVFCVDCTGSMGSYISAAQQNVEKICMELTASEKLDLRFALVAYRDHPPQDSSFVTRVHPFTTSLREMRKYCATMQARGGGDGPEAVTAALHEALHLPYRPNATKFCVLIADAPPHGLGEDGDGFPNGDPDGKDPIQIAHSMSEQGITLYVAACEPSVSRSYKFAADFFIGIAKITEGKCLPLASADLLAQVIVGGAAEEASLEALMAEVELEARRVQAENQAAGVELSEDALEQEVATRLQKRSCKAKKCEVDDVGGYGSRDQSNVKAMIASPCLALAKKAFKPVKAPASAPGGGGFRGISMPMASPRRSSSRLSAASDSLSMSASMFSVSTPQTCKRSEGVVETSQVRRMLGKAKARNCKKGKW